MRPWCRGRPSTCWPPLRPRRGTRPSDHRRSTPVLITLKGTSTPRITIRRLLCILVLASDAVQYLSTQSIYLHLLRRQCCLFICMILIFIVSWASPNMVRAFKFGRKTSKQYYSKTSRFPESILFDTRHSEWCDNLCLVINWHNSWLHLVKDPQCSDWLTRQRMSLTQVGKQQICLWSL